jgi:AcrR family transcriptional regulator
MDHPRTGCSHRGPATVPGGWLKNHCSFGSGVISAAAAADRVIGLPLQAAEGLETNRSVWFNALMPDAQARPRQMRAERTRSVIIETAALAFAMHGYDGVSLNDLVAASGVSKGAFYFHFSSKEDVALAAFRAKQQELIAQLMAPVDAKSSVIDEVRRIMRRRAEIVSADPSLRCVIRLGGDLSPRFGPGSEYASFQALAVALIADLIGRGIRSGEIDGQLEPAAAARAIFAWIVGMDSISLLESGGKDLVERTEEVLELLVLALTARQHPNRSRKSPRKTPSRGSSARHTQEAGQR